MNRNERRNKSREFQKELGFILKHTPYFELKISDEFKELSPHDIEVLNKGEWIDDDLQERFTLAKQIFTRVDYLTQMIELLKKPLPKQENVSDVK